VSVTSESERNQYTTDIEDRGDDSESVMLKSAEDRSRDCSGKEGDSDEMPHGLIATVGGLTVSGPDSQLLQSGGLSISRPELSGSMVSIEGDDYTPGLVSVRRFSWPSPCHLFTR
jgi:hypothetical protein